MSYDVPLPPCVERRRFMARANGWRLPDAGEIIRGIWSHDVGEREFMGGCDACRTHEALVARERYYEEHPVDLGTYADDAGHRLVAAGVWPPEMVMTAREIAEQTSRAFLAGKKKRTE